ncbi:hypothetical protein NIES593_05695 [Hydrococcus rivularis NIES-593]|uniref:Glycosyltransferase RgtA/B/C/D-like domain-containing protein n=1 Tax=Hydrococcus rivularis NIES-593 TaxID=1921803 RepID=A0A1U7HNV7_9CYAN|nr:hypothetical protein [Hydrococcus rivularis]OKH25249.1 hypothetical protein NIES593_05695 [Hydrococcus rivularis NIES-593]
MSSGKSARDNTGIYLLIILAIAALLRLLFLDAIPQGFNCDEAADGYEAYSILETLRDRYGKFLPTFFLEFRLKKKELSYSCGCYSIHFLLHW